MKVVFKLKQISCVCRKSFERNDILSTSIYEKRDAQTEKERVREGERDREREIQRNDSMRKCIKDSYKSSK